MQTSLYSVTVPSFIKTLTKLSGILDKASVYAAEHSLAESELLDARLAPDMFPLSKQIQVVCDQAKALAARLNGTDPVAMEDNEKSFAELKERINKTIELLNAVAPSDVDGHEGAQVTIKYFPGMYMNGQDYALEYVLPNFYFHAVTAYDILRMKGVPLGKADIASLSLQKLA